LASDIPDADLVIIPEPGQFVIEDAPERVTEEILDDPRMQARSPVSGRAS
jgi:hypothetical protein